MARTEGGKVADLIRALTLADTPLGPSTDWPRDLLGLIGMLLPAHAAMIAFWGPDHLAFYNDSGAALLGDRHPGALARPACEIWREEWHDVEPLLLRARAGETVPSEPETLDETRRPGALAGMALSPMRTFEGAISGVLGIATERSRRLGAERRLRESEDALRMRDAELARIQRIGRVCGVEMDLAASGPRIRSPAYLGLHGLAPDTPRHGFASALDRIHPDDRARVETTFRAAVSDGASGYESEYRIVLPSTGEIRWLAFNAEITRDPNGNPLKLIGVITDVTDRAKAEIALREVERVNTRILDSSPDCILVLDIDGGLVSMSRGTIEALEIDDTAPWLGRSLLAAWSPSDPEAAQAALAHAKAGGIGRFQGLRPTMGGEPKWWDVVVSPVLGADGTVERLTGVARDVTEARSAIEASRRSDAELRQITDALPILIAYVDRDLIYRYNNRQYERALGRPLGSVTGRSIAAVLGEAAYQSRRTEIERALAGERVAFDGWMPDRNGDRRPAEIQYLPRILPDGQVDGFHVLVIDIGERKEAERALRESEERFRLIADSAPVPIWVSTLTGRRTFVNQAYLDFIGLPYEAGMTFAWHDILHPDDLARILVEQRAGVLSGKPFTLEARYRRADGEWRWLRALSQPRLEGDHHIGFIGVAYDVTAAKQAEFDLRGLNETLESRIAEALAQRKLWSDVFETTDALISILAPDFRVLAANRAFTAAFTALFGTSPKVGDDLLALMPEAAGLREIGRAIWSRALGGEEFTIVEEFPDRAGRRHYYELRHGILRDATGRIVGAFQYAIDVSERLQNMKRLAQTEEQLRQAQKMEAIGQLTGGIAHDFNNLLTGIIGSLDLMQTRIAQGRIDTVARYSAAALTSARRAAALTHRLLAFARRQPLDPRPVRPNALVASIDDLVRRTLGESIALEIVLADDLWPTLCDANQLENALLNLVINARDAMPDGGRVTIATSNTHLPPAAPGSGPDVVAGGDYISLRVSDTGIGMSADIMARAFEPFFTTKPLGQGTGLGLSMIYGFARQSEGHARITSRPGRGTSVTLLLPRYAGEIEPETLPARPSVAARGNGRTVLVVEDEPVVRDLVVEVLADLGFRPIEAADGPSGLKILQSRLPIDLLVTDIGLPGLNGRQLADAARVTRPDLKILFITGYAETAALANGVLEPGMAMITKPFAFDALAARIAAMTVGEDGTDPAR